MNRNTTSLGDKANNVITRDRLAALGDMGHHRADTVDHNTALLVSMARQQLLISLLGDERLQLQLLGIAIALEDPLLKERDNLVDLDITRANTGVDIADRLNIEARQLLL